MGFENKTVKIIVICVVVFLVIELEVWPKSEDYYTWEEPVIQFRANDPGSYHVWVRRINDFLRGWVSVQTRTYEIYETTVPEVPPRAPCSVHHRQDQHMRSASCDQAMNEWKPCTADDLYGFPFGKPCIFLRLSHIHYWVPEPYNFSTPLAIPQEMPEIIKQAMRQHPAHRFGDYVWVSCDGEYPSDQENLGPVQYVPAGFPPGFPTGRLHTADRIPRAARHLPDQDPGPLVAVWFENPRRGVLINVECRVWTRDLYYDRYSRYGRARFELYID